MNICEYTQMLDKKKIQFSEEAQEELRTMEAVCLEVLDLLEQESIEPTDWLTKVSALEQRMDDMTEEYRRNQMKRMKQAPAQTRRASFSPSCLPTLSASATTH